MAKPPRKPAPLPGREELIAFIEESPGPVGKREIARAFNIRGSGERALLKDMLRDLEAEGLVGRRRRRVAPPGRLPRIAVVEVTGIDGDGEPLARPLAWRGEGDPPRIVMLPEARKRRALAVGDRVLARLKRISDRAYEGRSIRRLPRSPDRILGIFRKLGDEGRLLPTDRRLKSEFAVAGVDAMDAHDGEVVLAESLPARRLGLPRAKIVERLGASLEAPRAISLIAIHSHVIPVAFPERALAEAKAARPVVAPDGRDDLRELPLVTIDGADARDFDDAVWAEPDPERSGGWRAVVAIADVAYYVRPGSALDRAARERGNSVYFPDRVVPMLPEALSNGLCSLKPGETRPCLAVRLWIDGDGRLRRHRFVRALMRSEARLTYEQVQAAENGDASDGPLRKRVIAPLYGVYRALKRARERRGTIDLDLTEYQAVLDPEGRVVEIRPRPRLESHRLIEELMIAANVAAAETLETLRAPVMYRVHDRPAPEKLVELGAFLRGLGHRLSERGPPRPEAFAGLLREVEGLPHAAAVNTAILRTQSRAAYSPHNLGHFGLSLGRYSHFTSPIRRYADLLVHRALIRGLGLGPGGLPEDGEAEFDALGEHLSATERRADAAERDAMDRFTALYMAERVGGVFAGRISGVTRFGLFVTLDETGADGIVPRRALPGDFLHDEERQELIGDALVLRLGDPVEVRLREAEVATGSLVFELVSGGVEITGKQARARRGTARRQVKSARRRSRRG
ncbi:MAG: ribonuclease R [Alphaproteobacteria bacterium]